MFLTPSFQTLISNQLLRSTLLLLLSARCLAVVSVSKSSNATQQAPVLHDTQPSSTSTIHHSTTSSTSSSDHQRMILPAGSCEPQGPRSDCGYFGIQQAECEGRGCCWQPVASAATSSEGKRKDRPAANDIPWCFFPNGQPQPLYEVVSVQPPGDPASSVTSRLQLRLRPGTWGSSQLGPDFPQLEVAVTQLDDVTVYVRVQPEGAEGEARWRVPQDLLPRPPPPARPPGSSLYQLHLPTVGQDSSLKITRRTAPSSTTTTTSTTTTSSATTSSSLEGRSTSRATSPQDGAGRGTNGSLPRHGEEDAGHHRVGGGDGEVLLDLDGGGCLVFKPQFLQLRSRVAPNINLYGMGETTQPEGLKLRRDGTPRALWNSDTAAAAVGVNLYGSHPLMYGIDPGSGSSFGWFLANSNAMEVAVGRDDVTLRSIGGIIELFLFAGPDPESVSRQYQGVVGRPALPPRWTLGFHQSRYGYGSVDELEGVVAAYEAAGIPLEVLWSDIDYTDQARMFTVDPERYPLGRLRGLVDRLHASGRRWLPIIDCGITALPGQGYLPYDSGMSYDVFIKDSSGRPLLGQVWSGPTHWPDFLHPNATSYWGNLLARMYEQLPYDGIWLDMNEPSNFCTGECRLRSGWGQGTGRVKWVAGGAGGADGGGGSRLFVRRGQGPLGIACEMDCSQPSPSDQLSHPPYAINNGNRRAPLYGNTLPMTATGYGGVRQYDAHNLYALAESRVTFGALAAVAPGTRPFILTRSSWSGQGRYAAHWTGDNAASWDDLRRSVGGLLASSWSGMAAAGADICGFMGASNEQLCARWLSAGAFYTFSRDHSDRGSPPQEPYRWPAAAEAARNALRARYSLLPYIYSCFHTVHTVGGTVARPLAWVAPTDPRVADLASQWLLGPALMVAPVLSEGAAGVDVYFPGPSGGPMGRSAEGPGGGTWCRYGNLGECYTGPSSHYIPSPLGATPPLFLRSGYIVPTQTAPTPPALTTAAFAASPLTLLVLLSATPAGSATSPGVDLAARGRLFADNGTDPGTASPPEPKSSVLLANMTAGMSLATGEGWLSYSVERAPPPLAAAAEKGTVEVTAAEGEEEEEEGQEGERGWDRVVGAAAGDVWRRRLQGRRGGGGSSMALMNMMDERGGGKVGSGGRDGGGGGGGGGNVGGGADVDVRLLVVGEVQVLGVVVPQGSSKLQVAVEVRGREGSQSVLVPVPEQQVSVDVGRHLLTVRGLQLAAVTSFNMTWRPGQ